MPGLMENVNLRTQMVGQNRLEMLLFGLGQGQTYGINVFKVKEVLQCPKLTRIPKRNPTVLGVAHIRDATMPILDLRQAIGGPPLENICSGFVIITEYNRTTQGFLVASVERIVNMSWSDIVPPPKSAGDDNFLVAVTQYENKIIEILDVEKVLAEVSLMPLDISEDLVEEVRDNYEVRKHVLVIDDSIIARKQMEKVMKALNIDVTVAKNGREGLDYINSLIQQGRDPNQELLMIISDIEMPEMDGYTFTNSIRANPELANLHVLLHTSLSGVFNEAMVRKVGANDFLAKFHPDELAQRVSERVVEMGRINAI